MKPTSDLLGVAAGLYVDIVVKIMFRIKAGNNYYLVYGTYIRSGLYEAEKHKSSVVNVNTSLIEAF